MLVSARRIPSIVLRRLARPASTTARDSDKLPTNDPQPPKNPPNVSATNALPVSTQGIRSGALQESPQEAEEMRSMQAPNRKEVWSRSQQPREGAMTGPRFEQTIMEYQVRSLQASTQAGRTAIRWRISTKAPGRVDRRAANRSVGRAAPTVCSH